MLSEHLKTNKAGTRFESGAVLPLSGKHFAHTPSQHPGLKRTCPAPVHNRLELCNTETGQFKPTGIQVYDFSGFKSPAGCAFRASCFNCHTTIRHGLPVGLQSGEVASFSASFSRSGGDVCGQIFNQVV